MNQFRAIIIVNEVTPSVRLSIERIQRETVFNKDY